MSFFEFCYFIGPELFPPFFWIYFSYEEHTLSDSSFPSPGTKVGSWIKPKQFWLHGLLLSLGFQQPSLLPWGNKLSYRIRSIRNIQSPKMKKGKDVSQATSWAIELAVPKTSPHPSKVSQLGAFHLSWPELNLHHLQLEVIAHLLYLSISVLHCFRSIGD